MSRCEDHCWSCGFSWLGSGSRVPRATAAQLYEIAVEEIEQRRTPFTVTDIWLATRARAERELRPEDGTGYRWGPTASTYARHAVQDMARHDLIRCVRRRQHVSTRRGQCMAWWLTDL